jgi:cell division septation protein DedD
VTLVLAAVAAGCGGHTNDTPPSPSAAAPRVPLSIDAPEAGTVIKPTRVSPSRVRVTVDVAGHADSSTPVRLDAGCDARSCSSAFFSDGAGEWSRRMQLRLPSSRRLLVITASTPAAAGVEPVRLTLRVDRTPKPVAGTKRRRSPARRPRTTSTSAPAVPPAPTTTTPATPTATETQPPAQTQPSPTPGRGSGTLVMIGDSLAVGVRPLLPGLLPGWQVSVNGRVSRPLAEGMTILSGTSIPSDGSTVLAVSLFTNDDPTHTSQLQSAVRQALARVGPNGCVVWATIARPPVNGVSYDAANSLLARLARSDSRLQIVPWAEQTAARPSLLGPDGVHPTPAGYQLRARLYAEAAQSC